MSAWSDLIREVSVWYRELPHKPDAKHFFRYAIKCAREHRPPEPEPEVKLGKLDIYNRAASLLSQGMTPDQIERQMELECPGYDFHVEIKNGYMDVRYDKPCARGE